MKCAPLVCLLGFAFTVSGCSDSDEAHTTRKKITLEPTIKAPVEDPTKKMGTAVVMGKATGDFTLKYQFGSKPEVSTICPVEIALEAQAAHDDVEVEITGMDGIELDGQLTKTLNLKTNEPYLMRFTVVPLRIGVFYVTVKTKITLAPDNVQEQSFAIPFIAGDLRAAKPLEENINSGTSKPPGTSNPVSQTTDKSHSGQTK